jgi:AcrR family transcriptional regulator
MVAAPYRCEARLQQYGASMAARTRDAARSRAAILDAAERLFAERGPRGATLAEIAAAAGVATGTPSYFFGGKDALYDEVLVRLATTREAALRDAFSPVTAWATAPEGGRAGLRAALTSAVVGYLAFLDGNPAFARLIGWEAQAGAERLGAVPTHGSAVTDALRALRSADSVREFDPALASVALVSLCFLPVAHEATFRASGGLETATPAFRERYAEVVVDALLGIIAN